jgi:hypothetical protein
LVVGSIPTRPTTSSRYNPNRPDARPKVLIHKT